MNRSFESIKPPPIDQQKRWTIESWVEQNWSESLNQILPMSWEPISELQYIWNEPSYLSIKKVANKTQICLYKGKYGNMFISGLSARIKKDLVYDIL